MVIRMPVDGAQEYARIANHSLSGTAWKMEERRRVISEF